MKKTSLNYFKKSQIEDKSLLLRKNHLDKLKFNNIEYQNWCARNSLKLKFNEKQEKDLKKEILLRQNELSLVQLKNNNINKKILKSNNFISKLIKTNSNLLSNRLKQIKKEILEINDKDHGFLDFLIQIEDFFNFDFLKKNNQYIQSNQIKPIQVLLRIYLLQDKKLNIKVKNIKELIHFYFGKYSDYKKDHLFHFWFSKGSYYKFHYEIMQGKSIYKSFKFYFPKSNLTKKDIFSFTFQNNENLTTFLIKKEIANTKLQRLFLKENKTYQYLNNYCWNKRFLDFIRLINTEGILIDSSQIFPIWDYVEHNSNINLSKKKLVNIYHDMIKWHQEFHNLKNIKFISWSLSHISPYIQKIKNDNNEEIILFEITEISNSYELKKEGQILNHCIYSYLSRCKGRNSFIFSLKKMNNKNLKHSLTIHINSSNHITEVRGKGNRFPTKSETQLIKKWADSNQLTMFYIGGF